MNKPNFTNGSRRSALLVASATLFLGSTSSAQQGVPTDNNQLVGSWTLVTVNDERPDGSQVPMYGPAPVGMLIFDNSGNYSVQVCASGRPRFAANDRQKGTAEEYRAAVTGCNPHWGSYAVDPTAKVISFSIEHALYTNWEGTEQKRSYTLTGDELRYAVPNPPTAAANIVVVWKRYR